MVVRRLDLDGLNGEGVGGVLREHGDEDIVDDFGFGFVGSGDVDEDVTGLEADFRVVGVYYWGHGADCSVGVKDDGVDWRVSDYMQVA